ncbi:MAG: 50S ribosomal protein L1 [Candidatus Komeilibacteria bacterium]|jgi:large subunit ribosomal protein L1|nr:50S ribosomal protein L1 [Candidatus Komeilibacteria bacterium]MBT4447246.1 50S ribosomal protein L1 [Candidatus Komeilibacteria bacterium]
MSKVSKRLKEARSKIESDKIYPIAEAIKLVKETSVVKFDASIEVHARLGIDPKKGDQIIRASVVLPHGTGKTVKIAAFVPEDRMKEAKDAGGDLVGSEELIAEIKKTSKTDFDIAVTVPEMMPKLAVIAKVLGQKGLMPNPKTGTIGPDLVKMIGELKKGKVSYKNDSTANVHLTIGKVSFDEAKLIENFETFVDSLKKAKPSSLKSTYIKSLFLSSSMGPSIKVSIN